MTPPTELAKSVGFDQDRQAFFVSLQQFLCPITYEALLLAVKQARTESFRNGYKRGEQDGRDARRIDQELEGETLK